MNAFQWLFDNLIPGLANVWTWLSTPLFELGDLSVSPLLVLSTGVIGSIIVLKIITLINPIG